MVVRQSAGPTQTSVLQVDLAALLLLCISRRADVATAPRQAGRTMDKPVTMEPLSARDKALSSSGALDSPRSSAIRYVG